MECRLILITPFAGVHYVESLLLQMRCDSAFILLIANIHVMYVTVKRGKFRFHEYIITEAIPYHT